MGNDLDITYNLKLKKTAADIIKNTMLFGEDFNNCNRWSSYEEFLTVLNEDMQKYNKLNNTSISIDNTMIPMFILHPLYTAVFENGKESEIEYIGWFDIYNIDEVDYFYVYAHGENSKSYWSAYHAKDQFVRSIKDHLILEHRGIIGEAQDEDETIYAYMTCSDNISKYEVDNDLFSFSEKEFKIIKYAFELILESDTSGLEAETFKELRDLYAKINQSGENL